MTRRATLLVLAAVAAGALAVFVPPALADTTLFSYSLDVVTARVLTAVAVALAASAGYYLTTSLVLSHTMDKRRRHRVQSVLRLAFLVAAAIAVLGVLTDRWVPALVSLGVAGVAVSLAFQQPLLSLIGWVYVMTKRPYQVGDRVRIEDARGDVLDVDYLVTTLWEVNGELVTSQLPSGRHVTVPNSVVLTSPVVNYSHREFPFVWNELPIQLAYETDLEFARSILVDVAEDYLGDEMRREVQRFRDQIEASPVDLEVNEAPTVNVHQEESWVELRLRYVVDPKQAQRVRNELYERALARLNEHPDRVKFPVGRFR